jgi:hypothetical protein
VIAFIKTRSDFSLYEAFPYHLFRFVELFPDKQFVYFCHSIERLWKKFGKENFPQNVIYADTLEYDNLESLHEKRIWIDQQIERYSITKLITSYNHITGSFIAGEEVSNAKYFKKLEADDKLPTFNSHRGFFNKAYLPYYLSQKVDCLHVYIDPQELLFSKILNKECSNFFYYDNPRIQSRYLPFIEYSFLKEYVGINIKEQDFVFGFGVNSEDREFMYNEINKIKEQNINFFVKHKKEKINTLVNKHKYTELLKKSKFTLIIPSYEDTDFSYIRYWEALRESCIPLIHKTCHWQQAFIQHPEISQIIENNCLVDTLEIKDALANKNWSKILQDIRNTQDWKKMQNLDWLLEKSQPFYQTLL